MRSLHYLSCLDQPSSDLHLYHTPFYFPSKYVCPDSLESEANIKCFAYINPPTLKITLMDNYCSCAHFTDGGKGDSEDKWWCSVA